MKIYLLVGCVLAAGSVISQESAPKAFPTLPEKYRKQASRPLYYNNGKTGSIILQDPARQQFRELPKLQKKTRVMILAQDNMPCIQPSMEEYRMPLQNTTDARLKPVNPIPNPAPPVKYREPGQDGSTE